MRCVSGSRLPGRKEPGLPHHNVLCPRNKGQMKKDPNIFERVYCCGKGGMKKDPNNFMSDCFYGTCYSRSFLARPAQSRGVRVFVAPLTVGPVWAKLPPACDTLAHLLCVVYGLTSHPVWGYSTSTINFNREATNHDYII